MCQTGSLQLDDARKIWISYLFNIQFFVYIHILICLIVSSYFDKVYNGGRLICYVSKVNTFSNQMYNAGQAYLVIQSRGMLSKIAAAGRAPIIEEAHGV